MLKSMQIFSFLCNLFLSTKKDFQLFSGPFVEFIFIPSTLHDFEKLQLSLIFIDKPFTDKKKMLTERIYSMKIYKKIWIITEKFKVGRNGQIAFLPYKHQQQNVPTELNFYVLSLDWSYQTSTSYRPNTQ